jgi:glycosyltransferase involved in cell wall biosynthesis
MMVSVIIPCFNSEEYITRALESVLNQTYTDYEIILIDNNSKDNTHYILQAYMNKHPNKVHVFKEFKKGAPAARNKGLAEAKGEWVQFLDSDDELLPTKLKNQIAIAQNSKFDIIVGECFLNKTIKGKSHTKTRGIETDNIWKALLTSKLGITSANLWRREALLSVGGWNETRSSSQEYDLIFRMLKENGNVDFCLIPETIVHVRENSVHKSGDKTRFVEILDNNIDLRLRIKEYLASKGMLTKELEYVADTYIYSYLVNTTGLHPMSIKRGIVPVYVKKTLRQNNLKVPLRFIIKFHFNRLRNKVKNKILS